MGLATELEEELTLPRDRGRDLRDLCAMFLEKVSVFSFIRAMAASC